MQDLETIIVPLVVVLGSMVQASTGFGFGLIVSGLLIETLGPKDAVVVQMIVSFCLNSVIFWRLRSYFSWEGIQFMLPSMLVMVPIGLFLFLNIDMSILKFGLGIVLIAAVLYQVMPRRATQQWHPVYCGIPCGLFSGLLAGAFGAGGPPIIAYMASQKFERCQYVATVQFVFLLSALTRIISMTVLSGGTHIFTGRLLFLIAEGLVAVAIGSSIGIHMLRRIPEQVFRSIIYAMLFLLGIRYVLCG